MKGGLIISLLTACLVSVFTSCDTRARQEKLATTISSTNDKEMDELWGEGASHTEMITKDVSWYKYAKFGMFIHWGLYSDVAGEWNGEHYYGINEWIMKRAKVKTADYKKLAKTFNPVNFDADAITQLAVDAGMKYIIITTKHHDGFALFKSEVSDFNIVDATPYKKDPLKDLARACKEKGLKLGFYYSQTQDWTEKDAFGNTWEFNSEDADFDKYLREKAIPQIREIMTNYGDIACVWFDTPGPISREQVFAVKDVVEELQPNCLINSRIGHGLGDFTSLGDNEVPDKPLDGLWETPDTHNNTWAYSDLDFNWKTPREIINRLINVLAKGGNYTFNIGPKGDGSIPVRSVEILREVGKWTKANADAIYRAKPVYAGDQSNIAMTKNNDKVYVFVKEYPRDGKVWLPPFTGKLSGVSILSTGNPVLLKNSKIASYIDLNYADCGDIVPVIVLESDGDIVFDTNKILNSGIETVFYPHEAKLEGAELGVDRWMEIFGDWHTVSVIENWEKDGSKASWDVTVPEEGNYIVEIKYACTQESDMQEALFSVDDENFFFVPTFSGEIPMVKNQDEKRKMDVFKTRKLGIVKIDSGDHTLSIELNDDDKTGWIDLANLVIRPM